MQDKLVIIYNKMDYIIKDTTKLVNETNININCYTPKFELEELMSEEQKKKLIVEWRKNLILGLCKVFSEFLDGHNNVDVVYEYINKVNTLIFF